MSPKTLKHIAVDENNYYALKRLGNAADSFNGVVTQLLNGVRNLQTDSRVGPFHQSAVQDPTCTIGGTKIG